MSNWMKVSKKKSNTLMLGSEVSIVFADCTFFIQTVAVTDVDDLDFALNLALALEVDVYAAVEVEVKAVVVVVVEF